MRNRIARRDDDGFTLVEVIVALTLLSLVATGCLVFFVKGTSAASAVQRKQSAVALASQALDLARSYQPADLVGGRTATAVRDQWLRSAAPDLARTYEASQPVGATTKAPTLPLSSEATVSQQKYVVNTIVGTCYRARSTTSACGRPSATPPTTTPPGQVQLYRVIVEVTWNARGQVSGCTDGMCVYRASTLIDPTADPTWFVRTAPIPNTTPQRMSAQSPTSSAVDLNLISRASNVDSKTVFVVQSTDVGAGRLAVDGAAYADPGRIRGKVLTFTPPLSTIGTFSLTYYLVNSDGQASPTTKLTIAVVPVAVADTGSISLGTKSGRNVTLALGSNDVPSDVGGSVEVEPGSFKRTAGDCTAGTPDSAGRVVITRGSTADQCIYSYRLRGRGSNSALVSDAGTVTVSMVK